MPGEQILTVLATCYNHERFVLDCLEGIRHQTLQDFQFIIFDDASTDRSPALIRDWLRAHRIPCEFVAHSRNRGLCATLNEALGMVRGRYLAKMSTDDVWLPEKLERQLATMQQLPETTAVLYGDALRIDESGQFLEKRFLEAHGIDRPPQGRVLSSLLTRNFIPSMTTILRTQALRDVGGYDERLIYEDWDMWLRLSLRYDFAFADYVSAKYRLVRDSMINTIARRASPNRLASDTLILEKCVRSGALDPAQSRAARLRMLRMSLSLARYGDRRAVDCLGRTLRVWLR